MVSEVMVDWSEMVIRNRRLAHHYSSTLFWIEWLNEEKTDYGGKAELLVPKEVVDSWQSRDESIQSELKVILHPQEDGSLLIELERHEIKKEEKQDGA